MLVMVDESEHKFDVAADSESGLPTSKITVKAYKMTSGDPRGMGAWTLERNGEPTVRLSSVLDYKGKEGSFTFSLTAANDEGVVGPVDEKTGLELASILARVAQAETTQAAIAAHNVAHHTENVSLTQTRGYQRRANRLVGFLGHLRPVH